LVISSWNFVHMTLSQVQSCLLVERLLSAEVQVQAPTDGEEVEMKLSAEQVAKVFTDHVKGVKAFLFRQQPGQHVLKFLPVAYNTGFRAFHGTALDNHLKWLFRLIVHYAYDGKPGASQYLTEVAEAFMDCQAVQARVVERIGLQIRGVTLGFHGLVTTLLGEYKTMALKMLAVERIMQGKAHDDATPTHYENRLTEDLGEHLGLNADDVRRAALDTHAQARFTKLSPNEAMAAAARCRELFDLQAFLQTLVSELNSFNDASASNSLPRLFLDWACEHMREKHVVFDEETCSSVEVDRTLTTAILEILYLGQLTGLAGDVYRGMKLCDIFRDSIQDAPLEVAPVASEKQIAKTPCDMEIATDLLQIKAVLPEIGEEGTVDPHTFCGSKSSRRRRAQRHQKRTAAAKRARIISGQQQSPSNR
jgi:hypothetical protein